MKTTINGQEMDIVVTIGGILAALKETGGQYSDVIKSVLTPGYSTGKIKNFRTIISFNEVDYNALLNNYTIEWFDQIIQKIVMDSFPLVTEETASDGAEYRYSDYMKVICRCAVKLNVSYESICNYTPLILDSLLCAMNEQDKEDQYRTARMAIQNRIAANKEHLSIEDLIF